MSLQQVLRLLQTWGFFSSFQLQSFFSVSMELEWTLGVFGAKGVGKTSWIKCYLSHTCEGVNDILSEEELSNFTPVLRWDEHTTIKLHLSEVDNMTRVVNVDAALFLFDPLDATTIPAEEQFLPGIPRILVANKIDLFTKEDGIDAMDQTESLCDMLNFSDWAATSAKENIGISDIIVTTCQLLFDVVSTPFKSRISELEETVKSQEKFIRLLLEERTHLKNDLEKYIEFSCKSVGLNQ
eukprot:TRINITY_DN5381_c0_g1_i1.p1 TRINITY_DN5381_c0_g1~~TRINITY_DN5381_c0_g1_i1.p1  ORF type:complete len:239 (-),score=39.85 TRINITY_DN5381_c0_g1_i1:12-728(-)